MDATLQSLFYRSILVSISSFLVSPLLLKADQQHYNNVITGERAQGLGGAYTGVADDASGVYYNPGGLAFAQSNDISGSANAFYSKTVTYEKAINGTDWVEESGGTFAPFFGAMQKLDSLLPGLVAGFAYYTIDTQLTDQEKSIENEGAIKRYHRAANQRASTWIAAAAMGYRASSNLGIGFSLGYKRVDELSQISQNSLNTAGTSYLMSSDRISLSAHGMLYSLGIQWAPSSKLALGFMARSGQYVSQRYRRVLDSLVISNNTISSDPFKEDSKNPLGALPLELRLGSAFFASPRFMMTFDIDWHAAVTDSDTKVTGKPFEKDSVTNFSLGTEYYVTPSLPMRLGFFTNKDATKKVSTSSSDFQNDRIDYNGLSVFFAWAQPTSQVSLGVVMQQGKGEAQKLAPDPTRQTVKAMAYTLGFSATHSF